MPYCALLKSKRVLLLLKQFLFSWSTQHCERYCPFSCAWTIRYLCISISYLCNINVMNAMNNEIFYAESVHNSSESLLLLSAGHYMEVFQHFHSPLSLHPCQQQHHFRNCPKPFPKLSLFRESSLWQERGVQLFGQHLLDAANKSRGGEVNGTVGSNSQATCAPEL